MDLYPQTCYHLYNRTNNRELLFKSEENYLYFLEKFRKACAPYVDTIAYCLMPTHFHWLVFIKTDNIQQLQRKIGDWLGGYTRGLNKHIHRTGSLFQQHTKARAIKNDRDLLTVATYIHQNPVRIGLIQKLQDWPWSSYPDYIGLRKGTLPDKSYLSEWFKTTEEFKTFSEEMLETINQDYWV